MCTGAIKSLLLETWHLGTWKYPDIFQHIPWTCHPETWKYSSILSHLPWRCQSGTWEYSNTEPFSMIPMDCSVIASYRPVQICPWFQWVITWWWNSMITINDSRIPIYYYLMDHTRIPMDYFIFQWKIPQWPSLQPKGLCLRRVSGNDVR